MRIPRMTHDGRGWTYFGMTLGASISIYANIAEKYVKHVVTRTSDAWAPNPHPPLDGVALAAAAPVALWAMLEILIRVQGSSWRAWVVRAMAGLVAAVAFLTSFQHLMGLLLARGESTITAWSYPVGIDGLLVGSAIALWQIRSDAADAARKGAKATPETVAQVTPEPRGVDEATAPTSGPEPLQPAPQAETPAVDAAPVSTPRKPAPAAVSPHRAEIQRLHRAGVANAEIARRLNISTKTVGRNLAAGEPRLAAVPNERTGS